MFCVFQTSNSREQQIVNKHIKPNLDLDIQPTLKYFPDILVKANSYSLFFFYFAKSHIFVMPSIIEALGIVFFEAMPTGIPVIGGNTGGIVEVHNKVISENIL
jgi:glycosyltransferase involved in cell wall biosynthesis